MYGVRGAYGDSSLKDFGAVEREVAVDLAGRDVVEAAQAGAARGFEQRLRAEHVRAEEAARVDDRVAVVGLRGEVDDDVDRVLLERPLDQLAVRDVALDQRDAVRHVLAHAGVREQVEDDDVVAGMPVEPVADEVRADEAGAAGDEQVHA